MGFLKLTSIVIASILFAMSVTPASYGGVKLGIEVLLESPSYQKMLEGKRLGLITNPTGVDSKFNSTIELLYEHPKLNLCALFAPEHGLRGERSAGERVQQSIDKKTQLPVYSLYGKSKKPTGKMLEKIDVLIFDIQDIGVRTYTYISTLFLIMEAADGEGKEVFVLDRPNPLGGVNVEGPVLKPEYKSFIGMLEIPLIHGMTIGEIAMLIKGENKMKLKLTVVPMEGWRRDMVWEDTGLFWVPTSPHIPTPTSAFLYATTGTIGSRNLSNGVGYTLPFQLIGSEWISPFEFIEKLNSKNIPGVRFQSCWFKPFYSIFKDKTLKGVRFILTDSKSFRPVRTALEILTTLESLYPGIYEPPQDFNKIWGVDYILTEIKKRKNTSQIIKIWRDDLEDFEKKREKYLLYK